LLLRACDLVQAFPNFLLALAVLAAVERPRRWHIGAVFVLTAWASFARLTAILSRKLVEADFVVAARALGASRTRILLRHIVPNILGPVAVQVGTVAAGVVLSESALSFVGLGPADGVSLGVLQACSVRHTFSSFPPWRSLSRAALARSPRRVCATSSIAYEFDCR